MSKTIPQNFRKYFWDCEFDDLTMDQYAFFITERILNFGNTESVKWLLGQIDQEFLKTVVRTSRNLDKKTRNYWELMLFSPSVEELFGLLRHRAKTPPASVEEMEEAIKQRRLERVLKGSS